MTDKEYIDNVEKSSIKGFEGQYLVTRCGKVWSIRHGRFLKEDYNIKGYLRVRLFDRSVKSNTKHFIHRLVALAFIPNPLCKPEVNHKDCNIHNNNADNLEWVTGSENVNHSIEHRRKKLSEDVPF